MCLFKNLFICISAVLVSGFSTEINTYDQLKLNQIQVIGSHNSYKQAIDPEIFKYIKKQNASGAASLEYSHIPMPEQLDLGLLNLEIDVYADSVGGKYADPMGLKLLTDKDAIDSFDPDGLMDQPGFKTLHVPGIDFRSECLTFEACLQILKDWSDTNRNHFPIFVTINAKDGRSSIPDAVVPEEFTSEVFDQLDGLIENILGRKKLLIPDDVRGNRSSLEAAVLEGNWPLIKDAKGKFIFILDEQDRKREAYIKGHPALRGRIMFTDAVPGSQEAAILIMNGAKNQQAEIQEMVARGYIVRTRADSDTKEARNNDRSIFEAAKNSGAQIITTDYYYPSTHFKSDYKIEFSDGKYIRKNPLIDRIK